MPSSLPLEPPPPSQLALERREDSHQVGRWNGSMRLGLSILLAAVGVLGGSAAHAEEARDSVLLLGLHTESIEGYSPMFSAEGEPQTNLRPGYRTLVLHITPTGVRLASELPYLAVPQAQGFLYLGEASVSRELAPAADADPETPHFYDAKALWRTPQRAAIPKAQRELRKTLERAAAAGTEETSQVAYVTSKVLCVSHTSSAWTGGALAFTAQQSLSLFTPAGAALTWPLARFAERPQLEQFMHDALKGYRDDAEPVLLDEPYNAFWAVVDFRTDTGVCLDHHDGQLWLDGTVLLPGNSARSFTVAARVRPAPTALGGLAETANLEQAKQILPSALDVIASLTPNVWLVREPAALVAVNTATRQELLRLPRSGRVVMTEGARGGAVARWLKALANSP